jgi:hypothetical protein
MSPALHPFSWVCFWPGRRELILEMSAHAEGASNAEAVRQPAARVLRFSSLPRFFGDVKSISLGLGLDMAKYNDRKRKG